MTRRPRLFVGLLVTVLLSGCAAATSQSSQGSIENLRVSPQNTSLLVGVNRISVALLDNQGNPVTASSVSLQLADSRGHTNRARLLSNIGPEYGGIPVYVGVASFPDVGQYEYLIRGTGKDGRAILGHAFVTVSLHGTEVPVLGTVPLVRQPVLGDPGVTLASIDSGVPPDGWHTETIAAGVADHKPMVLYFGDPAYCPSKTCGPTKQLLQSLCQQFCGQLLFEHIETYYPAGPPGPTAKVNPAFDAFGLQTDPWIYFVNAGGVVDDRYEGPVTLTELVESAQATLAGHPPDLHTTG